MVHGITKFADLSQDEFDTKFLGRKSSFRENAMKVEAMAEDSPFNHLNVSGVNINVHLEAVNINWVTSGRTTAIKDQGQCGSCWAFSSVAQIESDTIRLLGQRYVLSEQQVVDCDTVDGACNGGNDNTAFDYVQSTGGIVQSSVYSYTSGSTGVRGTCKTSVVSSNKVVRLNSYSSLSGESTVAAFVQSTGPVTIYANADTWSTYTGGIITASSCPSTTAANLNHAIQIVGLVIPTSGTSYWIVRNQWGTGWGAAGYIYLAYGTNTCGMFSDKAYYTSTSLINNGPSPTISPSVKPPSTISSTLKPSFKPSLRPQGSSLTSSPTKTPISIPIPSTKPSIANSNSPTIKPPSRTPSRSPSVSPTAGGISTWTCPPYIITPGWYPRSQTPYVPCYVNACGGNVITVSSYSNGGSCNGDTWVALLSASNIQLANNDDANGNTFCSEMNYQVPIGEACQTFTIAQTCYPELNYLSYGYLNCQGTFSVTGAIKKLNSNLNNDLLIGSNQNQTLSLP